MLYFLLSYRNITTKTSSYSKIFEENMGPVQKLKFVGLSIAWILLFSLPETASSEAITNPSTASYLKYRDSNYNQKLH